MTTFNDFLTNAKSAAKSAEQKISDCYDLTKLKITKSKVESEMNDKFKELGEKYYDMAKSGEEADFSADIESIDELKEELNNIDIQIANAKNMKSCPVCSKLVDKDAKFCSSCGNKF